MITALTIDWSFVPVRQGLESQGPDEAHSRSHSGLRSIRIPARRGGMFVASEVPCDAGEAERLRGWDDRFRAGLSELLYWRRDVRRFRTTPLDRMLLSELLAVAALAPSVGNAQPWRFVIVDDASRRAEITAIFEHENAEAAGGYEGERRAQYCAMKLAGLGEAPVHLAVFCDEETRRGGGLGRRTMPETLRYSVV